MKRSDAETHEYNGGSVTVTEFNAPNNNSMNIAKITITGRYPPEGCVVNNDSTAIISVDSGSGEITVKGSAPHKLEADDNFLIDPCEHYFINTMGELAIRYIASPSWTDAQSRIVTEEL